MTDKETDRQRDRHTDIATYRLNRPKGRFSEKRLTTPKQREYTQKINICTKTNIACHVLVMPPLIFPHSAVGSVEYYKGVGAIWHHLMDSKGGVGGVTLACLIWWFIPLH